MKIGIDARCLEWQRGGVSRFLVKYLELQHIYTPNQKYILYFQNSIPDDKFLNNANYECKIIKGPSFLKKHRILCEQILLPFQLHLDSIDLLVATWYTAPLFLLKTNLVLCLWDISFITHPKHYSLTNRISLGFFAKRAAKKAVNIITCSEFDSQQIQFFLNYDSSKILTLNFPAEKKFDCHLEYSEIKNKLKFLNLKTPYILSLGVIYNRRNIPSLIDAFEVLLKQNNDINLVIVGRNATYPYFNLDKRLKDLLITGKVKYIEYIDEKYLIPLYKGAALYYCTSDVDGEAILLKEAMLSGTPILSSNMLKLATNNLGTYVENPKNKTEIAEAINYILNNQETIRVQVKDGLNWVRQISWENVIFETTNLLFKLNTKKA
jgi:glycosyltransferase involved in cell wall biosynthesis